MINKPDSESMNTLERLSKNLSNSNTELRERASSSILMKLELNLIPSSILISDYHFIIGDCLKCLNITTDTKSFILISNILKILTYFTQDETGKSTLKQYGIIEFMSEYTEYQKKLKNESIVEELNRYLSTLINSNYTKYSLSSKTITTSSETTSSKNRSYEKLSSISSKSILMNLSISPSTKLPTNNKKRKLSDKDRSLLIEVSTQLKFTKRDPFELPVSLISSITSIIRSFPLDILNSQFHEFFFEILKVFSIEKNNEVKSIFWSQFCHKLIEEIDLMNIFNVKINQDYPDDKATDEQSIGNYINDSYPCIFAIHNESAEQEKDDKLNFWNIVEIMGRLVILCFKDSCLWNSIIFDFTKLSEKLFEINNDEQFHVNLGVFMIEIIGFWEDNRLNNTTKKTHIEDFEFLSIYAEFLINFMKTLNSRNLLTKIETNRKLSQMFDFSQFSEWLVCGIIPSHNYSILQELMSKIDSKIQMDLSKLIELNEKIKTCQSHQSLNQQEIIESLKSESGLIVLFDRIDNIFPVFEYIDYDLSDCLMILLVGRKLMKSSVFESDIKSIERFDKQFDSFFLKTVCNSNVVKNRHSLLKSIERIMNEPIQTLKYSKITIDLKIELLCKLEEDDWLMILMIGCLENQNNHSEYQDSIMRKTVTSIIEAFFTKINNLPKTIDVCILTNYLIINSNSDNDGKNLKDYMMVKFKEIDYVAKMMSMYSKDYSTAFNCFNSLIHKISSDFSVSNEISKKMSLMGYHNEQKLNVKHHYYGLINESKNIISYKNPLESLSKIQSNLSFLDSKNIRDFFDIFDLFNQSALDKNIRLEALNQCVEILITHRKNREIKPFTLSVVTSISDRITTEITSIYTIQYIKIINVFFLYSKNHKTLKNQILKKLKDYFLIKNIDFIANVWKFIQNDHMEFKINLFSFYQLLLFNSNSIESLLENRTNQVFENKKVVLGLLKEQNEEDECTDDNGYKFKFWIFNEQHFFNFFGGKRFSLSDYVLKQSICPSAVGMIKNNNGLFYEFPNNLSAYFEAKYLGVKRWISESIGTDKLIDIIEMTISLIGLVQRSEGMLSNDLHLQSVVSKLEKLIHYVINLLKSIIKDSKLQSVVNRSLYLLSMIPSDCFSSPPLLSIFEEMFNFITDNLDSNSNEFTIIIEYLMHLMKINPVMTSLIIKKTPPETILNSFNFVNNKAYYEILEHLDLKIIIDKKDCFLNVHSNSMRTFESVTSFVDNKRKISTLKTLNKLLLNFPSLHIRNCYDVYLKCKENTKSVVCYIRFYSWFNLLTITKQLKDNQFLSELFYLCKDQIENTCERESPKINVIVLSILNEVVNICVPDQSNFDYSFLKKLIKKSNRLSLIEAGCICNLLECIIRKDVIANDNALLELINQFCIDTFNDKICFFSLTSSQSDKNMNRLTFDKRLDCFKHFDNVYPSIVDFDSVNVQIDFYVIYPLIFLTSTKFKPDDYIRNLQFKNNQESLNSIEITSEFNHCEYMYVLFMDRLLLLYHKLKSKNTKIIESKLFLIIHYINALVNRMCYNMSVVSSTYSVFMKLIKLININSLHVENLKLIVCVCVNFIMQFNKKSHLNFNQFLIFSTDGLFLLKRKFNNINCDSIHFGSVCVIDVLVGFLIENPLLVFQDKQHFIILIKLLSVSNIAKFTLFESNFFEFWQKEIQKLIVAKDKDTLYRWCQFLKALFYPLQHTNKPFNTPLIHSHTPVHHSSVKQSRRSENNQIDSSPFVHHSSVKQSNGSENNQINSNVLGTDSRVKSYNRNENDKFNPKTMTLKSSVKTSLKKIFITLNKMHLFASKESTMDIDEMEVLKVFTNWHLNPLLQSFLEKQTLKGKHVTLLSVIEILKTSTRAQSATYQKSLMFINSLNSVDFISTFLTKNKLFSTLTDHLYGVYTSEKNDNKNSQSYFMFNSILETLYFFSFNKINHSKFFENKKNFDCFVHFYFLIFKNFKQKIQQNLQQKISKNLKFSEKIKKILTFFCNLLLSSSCKIYVLDNPALIDSFLDLLQYTYDSADRLIVSQILYNFIFKDGSAVKILKNQKTLDSMDCLLDEVKDDIKMHEKQVLDELNGKSDELTRLYKIIKNIESIQEIVMF